MNVDALFKLTNGLYILGAKDGERYVGSLIDAVTQVAHKPLVVVISCTNSSYTGQCLEKTGEATLSVLCKDVNPFVIANFGFQSSREVDKWDNVNMVEVDGMPYLKESLAKFRVRVLNKQAFESNTLYMAEVVDAFDECEGEPLTYREYRYFLKNDVIKAFNDYKNNGRVPLMSEENKKTEATEEKHWICTVCGYVYDEELPFEDLPDDWVCPLCGVGKDMFEYK